MLAPAGEALQPPEMRDDIIIYSKYIAIYAAAQWTGKKHKQGKMLVVLNM